MPVRREQIHSTLFCNLTTQFSPINVGILHFCKTQMCSILWMCSHFCGSDLVQSWLAFDPINHFFWIWIEIWIFMDLKLNYLFFRVWLHWDTKPFGKGYETVMIWLNIPDLGCQIMSSKSVMPLINNWFCCQKQLEKFCSCKNKQLLTAVKRPEKFDSNRQNCHIETLICDNYISMTWKNNNFWWRPGWI